MKKSRNVAKEIGKLYKPMKASKTVLKERVKTKRKP